MKARSFVFLASSLGQITSRPVGIRCRGCCAEEIHICCMMRVYKENWDKMSMGVDERLCENSPIEQRLLDCTTRDNGTH